MIGTLRLIKMFIAILIHSHHLQATPLTYSPTSNIR
jgi:hypothetical protein